MNHSALLERAFRYFRSRRMRLFERTFRISSRTRVLDVGGSPLIWQFASVQPRLTILNLPSAVRQPGNASADLVAGDGCLLPFRDRAFDVVFSNSVIEHVGSQEHQRKFASEVARVGQGYWIQTPNRYFPVEPHVMLPIVHFLPKRLQRIIVTRFTVWQLLVQPSAADRRYYIDHFLNELRLLDAHELQEFFPAAVILRERAFGLTKSLVAVRG